MSYFSLAKEKREQDDLQATRHSAYERFYKLKHQHVFSRLF